MGRRKIEIQPITHERNRSVTFLKRKNGLFKKAYELGVLCSVDVAVIIFEERPGHHLKLYQYCSTDIHDIVQRHIRHDGEKDTRGPIDFSGNLNTKLDGLGDGDDDDMDDDDDDAPHRKRGNDGKLKPPSDLSMGTNIDYMPHRMSLPQSSMSLLPPTTGPSSSLPVSSSRHDLRNSHHHSHKKPRTGSALHHSRSPSDDLPQGPGGANAYYHPGPPPSSAAFSRQSAYQQHHPSQHHSGPNPQYTPFFPVSSHTPPPSFIPLQSDFPNNSNSNSNNNSNNNNSNSASGRGGGPPPPPPSSRTGFSQRGSSSGTQYESGMYQGMMRPPSHASSHHAGPPGNTALGASGQGPGGPGGPGGNTDMFAAFLDADEHSRQAPPPPNNGNAFNLDWPVHSTGTGAPPPPPPGSAGSGPPSAVSNSGGGPPGEGGNNWLDFLSGNNPPPGGARETGMSWERGGDRGGEMAEMFAGGDGRSSSGRASVGASPLVVAMGVVGKRNRGSESGDEPGLNGREDGKGDMKEGGG